MLCLENNFNFIQNESKEVLIMTVEKHLRVTGTSTISWKDAVVQTIAEASKTIDYLSSVENNTLRCILYAPFNHLEISASRRHYSKIKEALNF